MARRFRELRQGMPAPARKRSALEARRMIQEMPLRQLRAARELTQESLAKNLKVRQSEISKIEKRTDMYISTLAGYIKAMGGSLEVRACFPAGDVVKISQFESLNDSGAGRPRARLKNRKGRVDVHGAG
jgi:DNA-binding XRE family transcriptional regulator